MKHTLLAGTVIKVLGVPYRLAHDTIVHGANVPDHPQEDVVPYIRPDESPPADPAS